MYNDTFLAQESSEYTTTTHVRNGGIRRLACTRIDNTCITPITHTCPGRLWHIFICMLPLFCYIFARYLIAEQIFVFICPERRERTAPKWLHNMFISMAHVCAVNSTSKMTTPAPRMANGAKDDDVFPRLMWLEESFYASRDAIWVR